jgi:hypothetical protein
MQGHHQSGGSIFLAQHSHDVFQALEGEREHAVADQLLNDADADPLAVLLRYYGFRIIFLSH